MNNVLVFGEILWDIFGDKAEIGGASLNFAAHTAKLGDRAYIVSAIGNDALGDKAAEIVKSFGMPTDYVERNGYETGVCRVTLRDGAPSYELVRDVAYDYISPVEPSGEFDALYFGTLAQRGETSRATLKKLLNTVKTREVIYDVNIRQNFYELSNIYDCFGYTTILKISREEAGLFGENNLVTLCEKLSDRFPNLKLIAITLDKDGAFLYKCAEKTVIYSEKPKNTVVSTVGAGDSFSAALLHFYLNGESLDVCLKKAVALSDYVVTQLGAVPDYPKENFLV